MSQPHRHSQDPQEMYMFLRRCLFQPGRICISYSSRLDIRSLTAITCTLATAYVLGRTTCHGQDTLMATSNTFLLFFGRTGGGYRPPDPPIASAFGDTDGEIFGRKIFRPKIFLAELFFRQNFFRPKISRPKQISAEQFFD